MKFKPKQMSTIFTVLIAIGMFIILFAPNVGVIATLSTLSVVGGDIINPTRIQYVSSDSFFNEPVYSFEYYVTGSSGYATGTITPDIVKEFTGKQTISGDFKLIAEVENQTCVYTVSTPKNDVVSYSLKSTSGKCGYNYGTCPRTTYPSRVCVCCSTATYCRSYDEATCTAGGNSNYNYQCSDVISTKVGEVYNIDSAVLYDTSIKLSIENDNGVFFTRLTPQTTSSNISDIARVKLLGGLMGTQSCPVPSADTVLYRPVNTANLIPKGKLEFQSWYTSKSGVTYNSYSQVNTMLNTFVNSKPVESDKCNAIDSTTQISYSCTPSQMVSIPNLLVTVKASYLGVVVPSGLPDITSIINKEINSSELTMLDVTVRNIGEETDTFELKAIGKIPLTYRAFKESITAGDSKTIPIEIEGAGTIQKMNITACSVNSPTKCDQAQFKVTILPFCDKTKTPQQIFVYTTKGCQATCKNIYQADVFEDSCTAIPEYKRVNVADTCVGNCTVLTSFIANKTGDVCSISNPCQQETTVELTPQIEVEVYPGFHCTSIGKYTTMNNYMDGVESGKISSFIPQYRAGYYWIFSPVCDYVPAYGYDMAGAEITGDDTYVFDQNDIDFNSGDENKINLDGVLFGNENPVYSQNNTDAPAINTTSEAEINFDETPKSVTNLISGVDNLALVGGALFVCLAIGILVFISKKKR